MRLSMLFVLAACLSSKSASASSSGVCTFQGRVAAVKSNDATGLVYDLEVLTRPAIFCGCKPPKKGDVVQVGISRNVLTGAMGTAAEKVQVGYEGAFGAQCRDSQGANGCVGHCNPWLPTQPAERLDLVERGSWKSWIHPNWKGKFRELPAAASWFFRRAFSCGDYGAVLIGQPTKAEAAEANERLSRLKCDAVLEDGAVIRKKYGKDPKVKEAFQQLDSAS